MIGTVSTKRAKAKAAERSEARSRALEHRAAQSSSYADVLSLQRSAGNHAVSQLLQPAAGGPAQTGDALPPIVRSVLKSGRGQPLDPATRAFMESRFGYDFGHVRVHTGPQAAESARAVGAMAYTVGHHLVFAPGQHAPGILQGRLLLAHELAHVIQQSRGGPTPALDPTASYERTAVQAAQTVSTGQAVQRVQGATAVGLARQEDPAAMFRLRDLFVARERALRQRRLLPPWRVFAVGVLTDSAGNTLMVLTGEYGGGRRHAELSIIERIKRSEWSRRENLRGGRLMLMVNQLTCEEICAPALRQFGREEGILVETYSPTALDPADPTGRTALPPRKARKRGLPLHPALVADSSGDYRPRRLSGGGGTPAGGRRGRGGSGVPGAPTSATRTGPRPRSAQAAAARLRGRVRTRGRPAPARASVHGAMGSRGRGVGTGLLGIAAGLLEAEIIAAHEAGEIERLLEPWQPEIQNQLNARSAEVEELRSRLPYATIYANVTITLTHHVTPELPPDDGLQRSLVNISRPSVNISTENIEECGFREIVGTHGVVTEERTRCVLSSILVQSSIAPVFSRRLMGTRVPRRWRSSD